MNENLRVNDKELRDKYNYGPFEQNPTGKLRGVAGILAFVVGGLGVHRFYLKDISSGLYFIVRFVLAMVLPFFLGVISVELFMIGIIVSNGLIIWNGVKGIVDGIKLFKMSHDDFVCKYFDRE